MQEWSREEILSKIYNFLLDPKIQLERREVLMKAKQNLEQGQGVTVVLKKLHSDFQYFRRFGESTLPTEIIEFDNEIFLQISEKNIVDRSERGSLIQKSKRSALLGVILGSILSIRPIILGISLYLYYPTFSLMIILLNTTALILFWIGFFQIDGVHGFGWSIYLLIVGIFSILGSFIQLFNYQLFINFSLLTFLALIFSIISGIAFVFCFAFRVKAKN